MGTFFDSPKKSGVAVSREDECEQSRHHLRGGRRQTPSLLGARETPGEKRTEGRGADPAEGQPAGESAQRSGGGGVSSVKRPSPRLISDVVGPRHSPEPPGQHTGCLWIPFGPFTVPRQTVALPTSAQLKGLAPWPSKGGRHCSSGEGLRGKALLQRGSLPGPCKRLVQQ